MGVSHQHRLEKGPSPINLTVLASCLKNYPDSEAKLRLLKGFLEGFRIPSSPPTAPFWSANLRSVRGMEDVVRAKIGKEVKAGRVLGPFADPPIPNLRVSPLGVVPKKAPGQFRLIHHLSYPKGESVNDNVPTHLCSVRYTSLDEAVRKLRACGPGALMAKADIESAFRLLPVHPEDFCLLGFWFEGGYYIDRALPMGCSISCSAFECFSTFLEWVTRQRMRDNSSVHYLDDFLFMGPANSDQCLKFLATFQAFCCELGVPLAHDKTEGPVNKLTFLGIELDSVEQCSRLPPDKLSKLRDLLSRSVIAKKLTLRELQVIVGHLNFACRVIAPGRAFLRCLCDAMAGLFSPHHRIRVNASMREDMVMWQQFLDDFNGTSFWRDSQLLRADFQVHSDAAGGHGFGLYFRGHWCAQPWPDTWLESDIIRDLTFLELFPLVVAVHIWANKFCNATVRFWCDNQAVVHVVNRQTSRSVKVMRLVRAFVLQCLRINALFIVQHVPGLQNGVADALSRFQEERFRELAPAASPFPDPMPQWLWSLGP